MLCKGKLQTNFNSYDLHDKYFNRWFFTCMDSYLKISHWWSWMDYIRWCNLQKKNMFHLPHLIWPLSWTNFKTTNLTRAKFYEQDKMYQYKTNQNVNKKCIIWFEIISKCISYIYHWNGQKLNRPTRNQCKVIYFKLVMLNWILETHCDPFLNMTIWTWPLWYWVFDLEES